MRVCSANAIVSPVTQSRGRRRVFPRCAWEADLTLLHISIIKATLTFEVLLSSRISPVFMELNIWQVYVATYNTVLDG